MSITRTAVAAGVPSGFPFSLAAAANGICFISGMPPLDTDGTVAAGTFQEETDRAWRNTAAIAEAAGYSVEEIVFVQCVLADIAYYQELNDWWPPVPRHRHCPGAFHLSGCGAAVRRENRDPGGRRPLTVR
jgi:2-iminobutanoate/2-iminopropanoate deaminase